GFGGYAADAPHIGWRLVFTICGLIGMLYAIPLVLLLKDAPKPADTGEDERVSPLRAAAELLPDTNFILLVLYFTLPAIAGWVVRDWMPEILREKFNLGQGKAGGSAILFVQIASLVGAIVGGTLADRWMRTTSRGRIFTSAIGMTMFLPALFSVG